MPLTLGERRYPKPQLYFEADAGALTISRALSDVFPHDTA